MAIAGLRGGHDGEISGVSGFRFRAGGIRLLWGWGSGVGNKGRPLEPGPLVELVRHKVKAVLLASGLIYFVFGYSI